LPIVTITREIIEPTFNSAVSCKHNSSSIDRPILIKLYTVVVNDMRMCMKEDYSGMTNIKGDNSRGIFICAGRGHPL